MLLPHGTIVAVLDGQHVHLFRNGGDEAHLALAAVAAPHLDPGNSGSGGRHHASTANPQGARHREDGFAAAAAEWLNQQALGGQLQHLVVIADPRTLGELRRHYHKSLEAKLIGELHRDLVGHPIKDIEAALHAHA